MTTNFVRDNTALWDDKTDRYPVSSLSKQWDAAAITLTKAALTDIQSYLRSGLFNAAVTTTITDLDLVNATSASVGPEMDFAGFSGRWFHGIDVANSPSSRDYVEVGVRGTFSFPDGVTTSGSPTLTSASGGNFVVALIGSTISGSGIPAGTTITAVAGLTSLTMSANATLTAINVQVTIASSTVQDLAYWKHRGGLSPTCGIGVTPPDGSARLQVSPQDNEPAMGTVRLRRGPTQTGNVLALHDSTPIDRWWIDKDFYISGNHPSGGAIAVQAFNDANGRAILIADTPKTTVYSFDMPTGSGGVCRFRCTSGGQSVFDAGTDGSFRHLSTKIGFFGAAVAVKPTIAGSRAGNAALASLLTQLATLGLITDSTTA